MIVYRTGNLLNDSSDVLVNTVNCKGVMGAGLAKQFKAKFPEIFVPYQLYCRERAAPGCIFPIKANNGKMIINAFTKGDWRSKSCLSWVEECAMRISIFMEDLPKYKSIAIPPLGCGLGGLNWSEVRPLIVDAMQNNRRTDFEVRIYEP